MRLTSPEDLPGTAAPVLSATLLARIHDLNADYLELLLAERGQHEGGGQMQHLPARVHAPLTALSPAARSSLAAVPYTLYSLGFEDQAFWRAACDPPTSQSASERYARPPARRADTVFREVALLYAWHVATSSQLAARVAYAMSDATAQRLAQLPLWRVTVIAAEHPMLLMPRWPTNPAFWPDLVAFAAAGDQQRLAMTKLLGNQLIAAELALAAGESRPTRAVTAQSPRLRARKVQAEVRSR